jgi:hypothetical protein
MDKYTTVTLSNGIRVANFSSAHSFLFTDGTVLPACSEERCRALVLEATEVEFKNDKWTDIKLSFNLTMEVTQALCEIDKDEEVDICIVPLPVLKAVRRHTIFRGLKKVRGIRVNDRVLKDVHIDKFCI